MIHIFIYAQSTSSGKDARISEIAAVRVPGFGPYKKEHVQATFHDTNANPRLLQDLYACMVTSDPFVLVSYNREVTRALLRIENEKTQTEDKFLGRAWLDVSDLSWPLLVSGQVASRNIETLSKHFGVAIGSHSDSADMVTALLQIYGSMMRRYATALKGESMVREVGGASLANLRDIVGF